MFRRVSSKMWNKFVPSALITFLIQCWLTESYAEVIEINKVPTKGNLDGLGAMRAIKLLSNDNSNIIGDPNEQRVLWHFEEINNRFRRSLEDEENINRNPRQNDDDLNGTNNNDVEAFLESEKLQTPIFNASKNPTNAASVEKITSNENSSYLPPPAGNPWKPEISSYYPHQSSANSYYPQQSTCVCQPVYHKPPPPYSYYQPPELALDAYIGHSYGSPPQGQHLPIFKPLPFSYEHSIYPGSSYFKPSRPDEYHGSYEVPKHSFNAAYKNLFEKK